MFYSIHSNYSLVELNESWSERNCDFTKNDVEKCKNKLRNHQWKRFLISYVILHHTYEGKHEFPSLEVQRNFFFNLVICRSHVIFVLTIDLKQISCNCVSRTREVAELVKLRKLDAGRELQRKWEKVSDLREIEKAKRMDGENRQIVGKIIC